MGWMRLLLLSFVFYAGLLPAAELFTYKLHHYPVKLEDCDSTAKTLADKLSLSTGVKIFGTACKKDWAGTTIDIQYLAEESLILISTDMRALTAEPQIGSYPTYADCLADQKAQLEIFNSATGLTAVISYCYSDSSLSDNPFTSRIDAFGEAPLYPHQYVGRIQGTPVEDISALKNLIQKRVEAEGFKVAKVVISAQDKSLKTEYNLGILYYAKKARNWEMFPGYFSFESPEVCRAEEVFLARALNAVKATPLAYLCSWDSMLFTAHFGMFVQQRSPWIRSEIGPKTYTKYTECAADRETMLSFYRTSLAKNPLEAICDRKPEYPWPYRLRLIFACENAGNWDCRLDPLEGLPGGGLNR